MKYEFPYKAGDIINVYQDYQNENSKLIGTAKLIRFRKLGRSFILEDTMPELEQVVYNYQEWYIEWENLIDKSYKHQKHAKVKYLDTVGLSNSIEDEMPIYEYEKLMPDSFLTVNGIEIY